MKFRTLSYLSISILLFSCGSEESSTSETTENDQIEEVIVDAGEEGEETVEMDEESVEYVESDCEIDLYAYISDPDTKGPTNVRGTPNGDVVLQLGPEHQPEEEGGYIIRIQGMAGGWFKVNDLIDGVSAAYEIPGGVGWIHQSVVAVDTRNYGGQELNYYSEPDESSSVSHSSTSELLLRIKDICGDWALVKGNDNGKEFSGWIQTEWLCSSPVTNCS